MERTNNQITKGMKRVFIFFLMMMGTLATYADDFPYLTFVTTTGEKTSVGSASLIITVEDGKLKAGSQTFVLSDLAKMYFSTSDESTSTGIEEVGIDSLDDAAEIYDLQGRKTSMSQMRRGIYIIKTKNGTRKVSVK
jgi:hypothetical protein